MTIGIVRSVAECWAFRHVLDSAETPELTGQTLQDEDGR